MPADDTFAARSHARISASPASRAAMQHLTDFIRTLYPHLGAQSKCLWSSGASQHCPVRLAGGANKKTSRQMNAMSSYARLKASVGVERQPSSLLASALCFPRGSFARGRCLLNSEVFELRTSLELLAEPHGLRSSACPGVALLVAIFGGHFCTFQPASSSAAYLAAKL